MILFLLAYLGGVLTIVSPCILPVLPFVFARADKPFVKSGLPMLAGMAATFAVVATLAAVGGGWAVEANQYGRFAAIALLALFGIALLVPEISERLTRPLVDLGAKLSMSADRNVANGGSSILPSLLLGVATGLLWAPCAGPVLGLILTGAALQGANTGTSLLLLAYALGAATSLALALLVGGRVFAAMKRSLGVSEWVRRGLGVLVLAAVAAIALGLDTGFLTQVSLASTSSLEQGLLDKFNAARTDQSAMSGAMKGGEPAMTMSGAPAMAMTGKPAMNAAVDLPVEGAMPALDGAVEWINSPPLTAEALKGKVVLVDFWTYSCINCLRSIPYVKAWAEKYRDQGLVVIGVHSPEFAFEKVPANVRKAVSDLNVGYPVAIDNDYAIWRAFRNEYWPAHYFIDARGQIRHHHFGEGDYDGSERIIQQLLAEAGNTKVASDIVKVSASGAEAAAAEADMQSPETYVGYGRAENFVSPGGAVQDAGHIYAVGAPALNQWGLAGDWTIAKENATLNQPGGGIAYRFHARDLHLVLGPSADGKPLRFKVTVDGKAPGADHGTDTDADGNGTVTGQRLYQLVRQSGAVGDRLFEIEFLDPGAQAFAFTFG
ncbi:cytochrome c biogenesis protein DipZ [Mesorhizobium sp. B2-3-4]|uniref:cytochrome c biogenesis protein DipZ n=1 Tax=Mesorhizobium sp. B2-3-4 TaxID=2589959 RepID=UPI00112EE338|nr:cytochrome c biogenesis protein DipZ [Mesorhizobium sp. B2-3-4]TPM28294.1 cytochrome c biogenesis protein DipZ [Mesorhizobium sp. B2-3-4]